MHEGFDCAAPLSAEMLSLLPDAVDFVCRYLAYNPRKAMSRPEVSALDAAGLLIVSVWETDGRPSGGVQGVTHGRRATQQAAELGQPKGSAIYFAVDYDADPLDVAGVVRNYFRAAAEIVHEAGYKLGAYGSGYVLTNLPMADYRWLACASGWRGTAHYDQAEAHIVQYAPNSDPWGFGYPVDRDRAFGDDFGAWTPEAAA